jgi:hypothetical protein
MNAEEATDSTADASRERTSDDDIRADVARGKLAPEWDVHSMNLQTMKDATKPLFTNDCGVCESLLFLSNRQSGKTTMLVRYLVAIMTETTHSVKIGIVASGKERSSMIMREACSYMNIQLPMSAYSAIVHSDNGSLVHLKCMKCTDTGAVIDLAIVDEPTLNSDPNAMSKNYPCIMVGTDTGFGVEFHNTRIIDQRITQDGVEHPEFIPPWKKYTQ